MCNPNSRKAGSLQPLASAKRKRAESPLQSALRAAVNRGGTALQPRLLFLQPNRRRSQPIWRGSSVRASLSQNRPNFAPRPFAGYFLHRSGKAAARGVTAAHRGDIFRPFLSGQVPVRRFLLSSDQNWRANNTPDSIRQAGGDAYIPRCLH